MIHALATTNQNLMLAGLTSSIDSYIQAGDAIPVLDKATDLEAYALRKLRAAMTPT